MRIAMVDPGGFSPPYTHSLCTALDRIGHDVRLFTTRNRFAFEDVPYRRQEWFYRRTREWFDGDHVGALLAKGVEHVTGSARLYRTLAKWGPAVVHVQWFPLPPVDHLALPVLRTVAPVVHTVHDSDPYQRAPSSRVQNLCARRVRTGVDHLVVHTRHTRRQLTPTGIDPDAMSVVPHGLLGGSRVVDGPLDATSTGTVAESAPSDRRVLFFGSIKPYKGLDTLLRAFAALPAGIRNETTLHVAGRPGTAMEPLRSLGDRLGIDERIEWDLGHVETDAVEETFRRASVVALPYRRIDQSGVLLTAIRAGVPVVASDVGGIGETVIDGVHGHLVTPGDPRELAGALERVLDDPTHRNGLSNAMRALAADWPAWNDVAAETTAVYRTVSAG